MKNQIDMIALFKDNQLRASLYEKISMAEVRLAVAGEKIQTILDGEIETINTAKPDDVIVRGTRGEEYIINKDKFLKRYEVAKSLSSEYQVCKATGTCIAYIHHGDSMEFTAAWGEAMTVKDGDYLATTDESVPEVYRIEKQAFAETYRSVV